MAVKFDTGAAVDFLKKWAPEGTVTLTAIVAELDVARATPLAP